MKMSRMISVFCVSVILSMGKTTAAEAEPENLYAQSAVLMDADSGRILFEKNSREVRANASTTKILTCILALEHASTEEMVTASDRAAEQPAVRLGMKEGQRFYLKDLLYSLMLESHNDTAVAVAEHISGSVENFAKLMNEKAEQIGCRDSHFVSPNGLDWEDEGGMHRTTAADLALLMRYCIALSPKKEEFLSITGTSSATFSDVDGKGTYACVNHNAFLSMMDGAISGKTGFTNKAGYCYVGALKDGKRTFVAALLACGWPNHKTYKWSDMKKLMNYGLSAYQYENVARKVELPLVKVDQGIKKGQEIGEEAFVALQMENMETELELLLQKEDQVKIYVTVPKQLKAPVFSGESVGKVEYFLNGVPFKQYQIVVKETADRKNFPWCFWKTVEYFFGYRAEKLINK